MRDDDGKIRRNTGDPNDASFPDDTPGRRPPTKDETYNTDTFEYRAAAIATAIRRSQQELLDRPKFDLSSWRTARDFVRDWIECPTEPSSTADAHIIAHYMIAGRLFEHEGEWLLTYRDEIPDFDLHGDLWRMARRVNWSSMWTLGEVIGCHGCTLRTLYDRLNSRTYVLTAYRSSHGQTIGCHPIGDWLIACGAEALLDIRK